MSLLALVLIALNNTTATLWGAVLGAALVLVGSALLAFFTFFLKRLIRQLDELTKEVSKLTVQVALIEKGQVHDGR